MAMLARADDILRGTAQGSCWLAAGQRLAWEFGSE